MQQVGASERFPAHGIFEMWVRRGVVVIEHYRDDNLIVDGARNKAARLFAGDGDAASHKIARIAFGTSAAAPQAEDAAITNQYAKDVAGFEFPDTGQVQTSWELGVEEANGMAIMEFGLLSGDGTLLCRKTRDKPINKESDISVEGRWTWMF